MELISDPSHPSFIFFHIIETLEKYDTEIHHTILGFFQLIHLLISQKIHKYIWNKTKRLRIQAVNQAEGTEIQTKVPMTVLPTVAVTLHYKNIWWYQDITVDDSKTSKIVDETKPVLINAYM